VAESGRGWVVTLGALSVFLVAAAASAVLALTSITERLNRGFSFSGESDPKFAEYIQLSTLYQVMTMLGPVLGIAAGLAVVALLFVLARRWDARENHRVTVGDYPFVESA
jgi:hypothetical protein